MNIRAYMRDWIRFKRPGGVVSTSADTEYDSVVRVQARVRRVNKVVFATDGSEKAATHEIATQCQIPVGSLVWIEGVDEVDLSGAARRVIDTEHAKTKNGRYGYYLAVV